MLNCVERVRGEPSISSSFSAPTGGITISHLLPSTTFPPVVLIDDTPSLLVVLYPFSKRGHERAKRGGKPPVCAPLCAKRWVVQYTTSNILCGAGLTIISAPKESTPKVVLIDDGMTPLLIQCTAICYLMRYDVIRELYVVSTSTEYGR